MGEGKTSRSEKRELLEYKAQIELVEKEILKANKEIGISDVFREHFPDNRFDSMDFLDLVKSVERVKNAIKLSIVFHAFSRDLNIDHQLSAKAVITATRPLKNESVKEIYSFEVFSSTE